MIGLILVPYSELRDLEGRTWGRVSSAFFNALHRNVFNLALTLFFAGAIIGKGRAIRAFFGARVWGPWAKLTFIVYLVHIFVITAVFSSLRSSIFITKRLLVFYSISMIFLSFIVSIPIALLIESPVLQIERLILFPPKEKRKQEPVHTDPNFAETMK